jgi:23S rRNA (cytosine1962-C5)-methyltransferase
MRQRVKLRKELARSIRRGHPWVYRDALSPADGIADGALVEVLGKDERRLATGFWDTRSSIAVRVLSLEPVADVAALVRGRLEAALGMRLSKLERALTNTFRWVHGEADGLPGVHVDLYDDVAALRFDGAGARAFYGELYAWLQETPGASVRAVVDRETRSGSSGLSAIDVRENGISFRVDLAHAQKGGLFLDQRDNRAEVRRRSAGRRVLNLFGYTGGFSLYAATGGARRTDTVDLAKPAIEAARLNFTLNHLPADAAHAGFHAQDVFEFLTAAVARNERWDLVICDPPSFAKSRLMLPEARRAYRRLFALAARVVAPGGIFCPASCSSQLSRKEFMEAVHDAVRSIGRRFELELLRGAGFDHPVIPAFPEGDYLKFALGVVR